MSPRRKHGGGRPRGEGSILELCDRWGLSQKAARRIAAIKPHPELLPLLVSESLHRAAAQRGATEARRYKGGMSALGMRSRVPGVRSAASL